VSSLQHILDCCPEARPSGEGWQANCPAHDDNVASLSIAEGDDGRVLLHCHAGCSTELICEAVEITVADLFPDNAKSATSTSTKPAEPRENARFRRHDRRPRVFETAEQAIEVLSRSVGMPAVAVWLYHSADGNEVLRVVRFEAGGNKTFRPISTTESGWKIGDPAGELPLYRLPELADDGPVFVAEGEKAAEAIRSLGFVATTSAHGAKSPQKTDWSPLAGRDVIILPDNDDAGGAYAEEVSLLLGRLSPPSQVRIVELPDLPEHGDVVEFVAAYSDAESALTALLELIAQSEPEPMAIPPAVSDKFAPFPVDVLPKPVCAFINMASTAIGCDPSLIALPLLTTFAAAIGTTRQIQLKPGWVEPSILWSVIVGGVIVKCCV
jgi:putative DNA primase/helicase